MEQSRRKAELPPIPAKRYFTIGEVSELCGVKPHVLRYWEQEFTQLKPVKRRGNRRYYQHHAAPPPAAGTRRARGGKRAGRARGGGAREGAGRASTSGGLSGSFGRARVGR